MGGVFKLEFHGPDHALLSIRGRTYSLLRAGKKPKYPKIGYATVMNSIGNDQFALTHLPIGNLMHAIAEGTWNEPTDIIVITMKDWQKLKQLTRSPNRWKLIQGGRL
jgi:hypothetical protein